MRVKFTFVILIFAVICVLAACRGQEAVPLNNPSPIATTTATTVFTPILRSTATPWPTPTTVPTPTPPPTISPQVEMEGFLQGLFTGHDLPELESFEKCMDYIGGSDGLYRRLDSYPGITWDRADQELRLASITGPRSRRAWNLFSLEVEAREFRYQRLERLAWAMEQQGFDVPPTSDRQGYWLATLFEDNPLTDEQWQEVRVYALNWSESEDKWVMQALELFQEVAPGCDQ